MENIPRTNPTRRKTMGRNTRDANPIHGKPMEGNTPQANPTCGQATEGNTPEANPTRGCNNVHHHVDAQQSHYSLQRKMFSSTTSVRTLYIIIISQTPDRPPCGQLCYYLYAYIYVYTQIYIFFKKKERDHHSF